MTDNNEILCENHKPQFELAAFPNAQVAIDKRFYDRCQRVRPVGANVFAKSNLSIKGAIASASVN